MDINKPIHIPFPSIEKSKAALDKISSSARFTRFDFATKKALYDMNKPLPIIKFRGTVKIHGANTAIVVSNRTPQSRYYQSRTRVLNKTEDFMGFWQHMESYSTVVDNLIASLFDAIPKAIEIAIFGEWCGENIQTGIALSKVPQTFVIFAIRASFLNPRPHNSWIDISKNRYRSILVNESARIYEIYQFPTFSVTIDFEDSASLEKGLIYIQRATDEVTQNCPVGKYFGRIGHGEGIVWQPIECRSRGKLASSLVERYLNDRKFMFKSKGMIDGKLMAGQLMAGQLMAGQLMAGQSPKEATVEAEKIRAEEILVKTKTDAQRIMVFFIKVLPWWRLEQGMQFIGRELLDADPTDPSLLVNWVIADVMKEEQAALENLNVSLYVVERCLTRDVEMWFRNRLAVVDYFGIEILTADEILECGEILPNTGLEV